MTTFTLTGHSADSPLDFLTVLGMVQLAPAGTRVHFDGTTPVLTAPDTDAETLAGVIFGALAEGTRTMTVDGVPVSELAPAGNRPGLRQLDPLVDSGWARALPVNLQGIAQWDRHADDKHEVPVHSMFFSTGRTNLQAALRDTWKTTPTVDELTAVLEGAPFHASLGKSSFRFYPAGAADLVLNGHSDAIVSPLAELLAFTAALTLPGGFRQSTDGHEFIEWTLNSTPMSAAALTALQVTDQRPAALARFRAPVHRGDKGRSHFSGLGVRVNA